MIVAVLVLAWAIMMIAKYRMASRMHRRRKRSGRGKRSGGMSLNHSRSLSFGRRRNRKSRGRDYTSSRSVMTSRKGKDTGSSISARKMKKNRKKTKESFGKSFYDF
jgi:hypothetical protein